MCGSAIPRARYLKPRSPELPLGTQISVPGCLAQNCGPMHRNAKSLHTISCDVHSATGFHSNDSARQGSRSLFFASPRCSVPGANLRRVRIIRKLRRSLLLSIFLRRRIFEISAALQFLNFYLRLAFLTDNLQPSYNLLAIEQRARHRSPRPCSRMRPGRDRLVQLIFSVSVFLTVHRARSATSPGD
jgi:hypothetical protein